MTGAYHTDESTTGPWVDVDLSALCANYAFIRKQSPNAETAAVVKCDAYGLGLEAVARSLAEKENCRTFFVVYPEEGAALRKILNDPAPEIYVFNGLFSEAVSLYESARLTPTLNTIDQAKEWATRFPGVSAGVQLDTGMNRLGAPAEDLDAIAALKNLKVDMVMSHLACASDPAHPMNGKQRARFIEGAQKFPGARLSLAASGGALMSKDFHFDITRPGIALYGGSPFDGEEPRLKPVAALRARIIQVRDALPGEAVGYGATYPITRPARLATVALGYGDGFPRSGSNRAEAVVNGERVAVAGTISMDVISLDVTDLKIPAKTGDIATFFGEGISLDEAANKCETIGYELLTGLGGRVDRRYL